MTSVRRWAGMGGLLLAWGAVTGLAQAAERAGQGMDCAIHPSKTIKLASPIEGVLAEVLVKPGQYVEQGELIARIDADIASADLDSARVKARARGALEAAVARVEAADTKFQRATNAFRQGVISPVEYEQAEAELRIARQELKRERESLQLAESEASRMSLVVQKSEIRAPAAGMISEALLHAGEAVEGAPVAELIVVEPMRVEVYAPVAMVEQLRRQPHQYVVLAGSRHPAVVEPRFDYISPVADTSSDTMRVYYELSGPDVFPGMRCRMIARDAIAEPVAHAVSDEALAGSFSR